MVELAKGAQHEMNDYKQLYFPINECIGAALLRLLLTCRMKYCSETGLAIIKTEAFLE